MQTNPETWIWLKRGDCLEEGSALCAKFVAEVGQAAAADDVNVGRIPMGPDGQTYTFLTAADAWWQEQMRVHPNGWKGKPFSVLADRFNL